MQHGSRLSPTTLGAVGQPPIGNDFYKREGQLGKWRVGWSAKRQPLTSDSLLCSGWWPGKTMPITQYLAALRRIPAELQ